MAKKLTEIRSLARSYSGSALKTLAAIMGDKTAPAAARVSASVGILDRGWGKPTQLIGGDAERPIVHKIEIEIVNARRKAED